MRRLPYDAARAGLELAILYLEDGRVSAVRALAREMAPVFQAQGNVREAFASLSLFLEAARQETATVELARRAIAELEEDRRSRARASRDRG